MRSSTTSKYIKFTNSYALLRKEIFCRTSSRNVYNAKIDIPLYKGSPEYVIDKELFPICWDGIILIDTLLPPNKLDIAVVNQRRKNIHSIDVSITNAENIREQFAGKLNT